VRPPEDEDSTGEDELLAQVIPLRRRATEQVGDLELSPITPLGPPPTGVFDPPEDPEPAGGYSVWEQPIAELIRRSEPEPNGPRRQAKGANRPRLLISVAAGASLCSVLVLTLLGWLAAGPTQRTRAPAGVHASVEPIHTTVSGSERSQRTAVGPRTSRAATRPRGRHTPTTITVRGRGSRSATRHAPQEAPPESRATVDPGNNVPVAQTQPQATTASVEATAPHEFGFER